MLEDLVQVVLLDRMVSPEEQALPELAELQVPQVYRVLLDPLDHQVKEDLKDS
jgi:hypothetical protein